MRLLTSSRVLVCVDMPAVYRAGASALRPLNPTILSGATVALLHSINFQKYQSPHNRDPFKMYITLKKRSEECEPLAKLLVST